MPTLTKNLLIGKVVAMVFIFVAFYFAWVLPAQAAINKQINYQGRLTTAAGIQLNATTNIKFAVYDSASGDNCLWVASGTCSVPTALPVSVSSGLFSLMLGDTSAGGYWQNALDLDFTSDSYFLGVTVGNDAEMTPRKRVGAAGYAFNADLLDGYDSTAFLRDTTSTLVNRFTFTSIPEGVLASQGSIYINPATGQADYTLIGVAVGGAQKFRFDADGDLTASNSFIVGDGSTTSTLSKNILTIGQTSTLGAGKFYVDLLGNVSASGTLNVSGHTLLVNTTSTALYASLLGLNSEYFTDLTGAGLQNTSGVLTLNATGDWTGTIDGNNFGNGAIGAGDILYGSGAGTISELAKSTDGFVLSLASGLPSWVATTTLSTITGTLTVAQGGTGLTSATAGNVFIGDTSSALQATSSLFVSSDGKVGLGTTSPADKLTISGGNLSVTSGTTTSTLGSNFFALATSTTARQGVFYVDGLTGDVKASGSLWLTNTTVPSLISLRIGGDGSSTTTMTHGYGTTSTIHRDTGFELGGGAVSYGASSTVLTISSIETATLDFPADAGITPWINMDVTTTTANIAMSYSASLDDNDLLTIYGNTDGSGGVNNIGVAIATSTAWEVFDVNHLFTVSSSTGNLSASGTLTVWGSQTASSSILSSNSLILGKGVNYTKGMFYVDSDGNVSASGTLKLPATAVTSTISGHLNVIGNFQLGSGSSWLRDTATSTLSYGLNLANGCFAVNGVCVSGGGGGVGSGATGQFPYYAADGATLTATSSIFLATSGRVGIGTSTPDSLLDVAGEVTIGRMPDATTDWAVLNSTSGTFQSTASIDAVYSSAVYNGSLYIGTLETNAAEVYRYDGGTSWTKVSQTTAGTIASGGTAAIDYVMSMAVYNGSLYIGTYESNAAEVYRYDGGTSWTKVSQATAGTIASGGTASIDAVYSMAVSNGSLYIGTWETGKAEVYRYDGGTSWTVLNSTAGTFKTTTAISGVWSMAVYNGSLYIGTYKDTAAEVYRYDGGTSWTVLNSTAGTFKTTTGISVVQSMAVYNGSLYIGTYSPAAEVYRYDGGTSWIVLNSTAGKFQTTTGIDAVRSMAVYNGFLYIGTRDVSVAIAEVYRYNGDATSTSWTVLNSTAGKFQTTTGIYGVPSMAVYNDSLYIGTEVGNKAEVYSYGYVSGRSYSLTFQADSNEGSIFFVASSSAEGYAGATNKGTFVLTNALVTNFGAYDIAEEFPAADSSLEPGDLVTMSDYYLVEKSSRAYDGKLIGVVSTAPAFVLGGASQGGKVRVALAGRAPVKVTDENGPISVGDYLVSASKAGYAMRYDLASGQSAGLVGMALEPLADGEGLVTVLVNRSLVAGSGATKLELNVSESENGQLVQNRDLDMAGQSIFNVKSITGLNGLWLIDEEGRLLSKEIKTDKVQAKRFAVEKDAEQNKSTVGEAVIKVSATSTLVDNDLVSSTVKIFITFRNYPKAFWWISRQEDGFFEVSLSQATSEDVTFDYWLVGVEDSAENQDITNGPMSIGPTNSTNIESVNKSIN